MTRKSTTFRLIALLLALLLCLGSVPESAMAEGETGAGNEFVSENLLQTQLESSNSVRIRIRDTYINAADTTFSKAALDGVVDGDTETAYDVYGRIDWDDPFYIGAQFKLNNSYFCGDLVLHAGIPGYPETWEVYASDNPDNTYGDHIGTIVCEGTEQRLTINRSVQYLYFVCTSYKGNMRVKEFELYSADPENTYISENVLQTKLDTAAGVSIYNTTGSIENYGIDATKLAKLTDGLYGTGSHADIAWDTARSRGVVFSLKEMVYCSKAVLMSGLSGTYIDVFDVYASDNTGDLYSDENRVAASISCAYFGEAVEINKNVKYIAFICTSCNGNIRPREFQLWSGDSSQAPEVFVSENVLLNQKHVTEVKPIVQYISNGNIVYENVITDEKLAQFTNGNVGDHTDLNNTMEWDPKRYIGAEYTLDNSYYIGNINVYASIGEKYPETYSVYASDNLDTLYTPEHCVAKSVGTTGNVISAKVDANVQYIAFFCESSTGGPRFKEIEAWTADPSQAPEVFVSENVLLNKKSETEAKAILQYASGTVSYVSERSENTISDADFAVFTNGDTNDAADLNNTMSWDPPRYIGAEYTLDKPYFIGNINVYASIGEDYPETYSVYASDNLDTLYTAASCVAKSVRTTGNVISAKVQANVQYIAFVCESCTGNPRVREIEAWTADPSAVKPVTNELKVLTIGNSFAQDASWYSSEVAKANGKKLTFGYLYYPSCTLDKHYTAATENRAVFRFTVVNPDSKRTQIKNVSSDFNVSDPQNCATIEEALKYYDWDVVVFQQESSNARNYDTFANLGNLITYVKGYLPSARLMFHEVWRWGEWTDDQFALIKANAERACKEYQLEVIPTGLAFEYARTSMGSETAINDNDGHYQHASEYGKFVAGCCYASALFGIRIDKNTLDGHPSIDTSEGYSQLLVNAANCGAGYYYSYKDLDEDGKRGDGDLDQLRKYMTGAVEVSDDSLADYTGDEAVDVRDVVRLKKYLRYPADI